MSGAERFAVGWNWNVELPHRLGDDLHVRRVGAVHVADQRTDLPCAPQRRAGACCSRHAVDVWRIQHRINGGSESATQHGRATRQKAYGIAGRWHAARAFHIGFGDEHGLQATGAYRRRWRVPRKQFPGRGS